jgi:splicing factor 3B subunit 2
LTLAGVKILFLLLSSRGETPALFTVLPEKTANVGAAMMGSSHIYDLSAAMPGQIKKTAAGGGGDGVDVALDPQEIEEMGMDAATTAKYEQEMKEKQAFLEKEDLSDMVAEHAARQKNKRKKTQVDSGKAAKKLKEFKF